MHCYFCCLPCLCLHSLELHIRDNCQKIYQSWIDSGCVRRLRVGALCPWLSVWLRVGVLYLCFFIKYSLCDTNPFMNSFPCSWAAMKSRRHKQTRWSASDPAFWAKSVLGESVLGESVLGESVLGEKRFGGKAFLGEKRFGRKAFWAKSVLGEKCFGGKAFWGEKRFWKNRFGENERFKKKHFWKNTF